jgi:hypothetical protein
MAQVFKTLLNNDIATTRTLLHEAIPITGSIVSGTYNDENIKNYSHGMFQSVYDYPYMSSSANHIFDISYGYSFSQSNPSNVQNDKKLNIYGQMAQVLVGYDQNGDIMRFDRDGDLTGGTKFNKCVFVNYSRLLYKDEIKKGNYSIEISRSAGTPLILSDYGAENDYRINSPAGEYGILYTGSAAVAGTGQGLIYYQAGVAVINAQVTVFDDALSFTGSLSISGTADNVRQHWINNDFNNTTELNSTIYFCRASHNEYNYSTNPTYLSESQIRVKQETTDNPVSYITTIGLYSADNELLAVAKLSEPLKKDPTNELTLRLRLDY